MVWSSCALNLTTTVVATVTVLTCVHTHSLMFYFHFTSPNIGWRTPLLVLGPFVQPDAQWPEDSEHSFALSVTKLSTHVFNRASWEYFARCAEKIEIFVRSGAHRSSMLGCLHPRASAQTSNAKIDSNTCRDLIAPWVPRTMYV